MSMTADVKHVSVTPTYSFEGSLASNLPVVVAFAASYDGPVTIGADKSFQMSLSAEGSTVVAALSTLRRALAREGIALIGTEEP